MTRWTLFPLAVALVIALRAGHASAFTAEQAAAGRISYGQVCVSCHGADLQTLPQARLVGPDFASRWQSRGVNELLSKVRATMPPEGPGALPENIYLNVLAYILQENGANAGTERLTTATRTTIGSMFSEVPAGAGAARAEPVAGAVQGFETVSEATLRNPPAGGLPKAPLAHRGRIFLNDTARSGLRRAPR